MKIKVIISLIVLTSFNPKTKEGKIARSINNTLIVKEATKERILINAIIQVESSGDSLAHNLKEDARGILQIRAIMVKEINRLSGKNYTHDDAWSLQKSVEMFKTLQKYYNPSWDFKKASKQWNGGYNGEKYKSTEIYWQKVNNILNNSTDVKQP